MTTLPSGKWVTKRDLYIQIQRLETRAQDLEKGLAEKKAECVRLRVENETLVARQDRPEMVGLFDGGRARN